jgi:FG-GAP-like repeat
MPFALHKRLVQLSVLLAGCMLVPAGAAAQISFPSHQVTQNSNVLEVDGHGDFNGDGREDLMVNRFTQTATSFTATPQLYLSNGNGTYQSPKTLPAPVGVGFTVIGDFNHDGKLDFVTTIFSSSSSSVSIVLCLGNGDGTFQAPKKRGWHKPVPTEARGLFGECEPDADLFESFDKPVCRAHSSG